MRTTLFTCTLFLLAWTQRPIEALAKNWNQIPGKTQNVFFTDSLDLPLANPTPGLARPLFNTIHLDISLGVALCDFSELKALNGQNSSIAVPLSFLLEIPFEFVDHPAGPDMPLYFISGFDFAVGGGGGGSLYTFSAYLLYRSDSFSKVKPTIGIGVARTWYSSYSDTSEIDQSIDIRASETYPILLIGLNLVGLTSHANPIDVLLTIPIVTKLQTTFESKSYSIQPAGMRLSFVVPLQ